MTVDHRLVSRPMRDVLIEHIDGPVPVGSKPKSDPLLENRDRAMRSMAIARCIGHGWLEIDRPVSPTKTTLTDKGRTIICDVLSDWADALMRAGRGNGVFLPAVRLYRNEEPKDVSLD
jgi:hypothetical protein